MLLVQGPHSEEGKCKEDTEESKESDFIGELNIDEITGGVNSLMPSGFGCLRPPFSGQRQTH